MKNLSNLYLKRTPNGYEVLPTIPTEITVQNGDNLELFFLLFNNELNLKVNLKDKETSCALNCVYLMAAAEKSLIRLDVNHIAPHTNSTQIIKGVVTDKAHVQFEGIIRIPKDSQKCVGMQNHRALVLSDQAQVQATPELEIYANDVQCAHGSAVGPLDKESLFYLMARGIDEATAQKMLVEAFVLNLIPPEYHETAHIWLDEHILKRA